MDNEQIRIQEDLRGLVEGAVQCDSLSTQLYSTDASVYEVQPLGVIYPKHRRDVIECVRYAAEHSIPIFPRGGGSGVAGQSLGPGLILDFSVSMTQVSEIDDETQTVRVEPGVVLGNLNRRLAKKGFLFGPDPVTRSVSTIGSAIAIDASGSHYPVYGSTADSIHSLDVVLASGQTATLSRHNWQDSYALSDPDRNIDPIKKIARETGQLIQSNRKTIENAKQQKLSHRCGFRLDTILQGDYIDLAKLQAGAEGTLAIITGAKLKIHKSPTARGVVLLSFERLESAALAALEARKDNVSACDLLDRRLLEIAREIDHSYESLVHRGAEAALLIEHSGDDPGDVRKRLMALVNKIVRRHPKVVASRITTEPNERNHFWRLSRQVNPRLYRLKGNSRPLPFIDAITLPPERLPNFLTQMQSVMQENRVTATVFAHAAHGHVQIRPFLDMSDSSDIAKMKSLAEGLYQSVIDAGGIAAGENGIGLSRSWFARQQLGELYPIARSIKRLFDPSGLLNPGKLVTDAPQRIDDNLRPIGSLRAKLALDNPASTPTMNSGNAIGASGKNSPPHDEHNDEDISKKILPILSWSESESIDSVARSCNGCGRCRSENAYERMCPMFREDRRESVSPRAKANIMRGLLSGNLDIELLEDDQLKQISDSCFNCHQCRVDCPATVDIPKIVTELKSQYVASHGLQLSDKLLSRLDLLAAFARTAPRLANWCLRNSQMRWLLEKATGIAQSRRLPMIANQSFLRWAARRRLNRPKRTSGRKILFFVDQYANWHNPLLAQAVVKVFQHQKVEVFVPSNQSPSFEAKIAMGEIQQARKLIQSNITMLAESVRQGYEIVAIEPSATLALTHEYPHLIHNDDTRLIAENSSDACAYLWRMHERNELELDLRPTNMTLLYHQPCHLRVLDPNQSGVRLLGLIPGLNVETAEAGCSGMAGTFGLKRSNFRKSIRIGRPLMNKIRKNEYSVGSTECTACKLQMEQRTDKPTLHPIAILAHAYGLMPEMSQWIQRRNEGLLVR